MASDHLEGDFSGGLLLPDSPRFVLFDFTLESGFDGQFPLNLIHDLIALLCALVVLDTHPCYHLAQSSLSI